MIAKTEQIPTMLDVPLKVLFIRNRHRADHHRIVIRSATQIPQKNNRTERDGAKKSAG